MYRFTVITHTFNGSALTHKLNSNASVLYLDLYYYVFHLYLSLYSSIYYDHGKSSCASQNFPLTTTSLFLFLLFYLCRLCSLLWKFQLNSLQWPQIGLQGLTTLRFLSPQILPPYAFSVSFQSHQSSNTHTHFHIKPLHLLFPLSTALPPAICKAYSLISSFKYLLKDHVLGEAFPDNSV